jgi:hypothetical protein
VESSIWLRISDESLLPLPVQLAQHLPFFNEITIYADEFGAVMVQYRTMFNLYPRQYTKFVLLLVATVEIKRP